MLKRTLCILKTFIYSSVLEKFPSVIFIYFPSKTISDFPTLPYILSDLLLQNSTSAMCFLTDAHCFVGGSRSHDGCCMQSTPRCVCRKAEARAAQPNPGSIPFLRSAQPQLRPHQQHESFRRYTTLKTKHEKQQCYWDSRQRNPGSRTKRDKVEHRECLCGFAFQSQHLHIKQYVLGSLIFMSEIVTVLFHISS